MPLFFTHVDNHSGFQRDEIGQEFISLEAAITEAGRTTGAVLAEDVAANRTPTVIRVTVERDDGVKIASILVQMSLEILI